MPSKLVMLSLNHSLPIRLRSRLLPMPCLPLRMQIWSNLQPGRKHRATAATNIFLVTARV